MSRQRLGQHFLRDDNVIKTILNVTPHQEGEIVVEIGPGTGVLTRALLDRNERVVAVEWDEDLIAKLIRALGDNNQLSLIHADIRKLYIIPYLKDLVTGDLHYSVIANLPYYLTSYLLRQMFEYEILPERMTLLIQKEVAERICASPGSSERSVLSVMVQAYATPTIAMIVPPTSFYPPPQVESAVLVLNQINNHFFDDIDRRLFFRVVKAGFGEKRKVIANALSGGLHLPKDEVRAMLKMCDIDPESRSQELTNEQWKRIALTVGKV